MASSEEDCPGREYYTPTQSDTTADPAGPFRAIYVGVTGNLKITDYAGNAVTFANIPVGLWPIGGTRVWSTGTTATTFVCVSANDHQ